MTESPAFEFGENWRRFLAHIDSERIARAERSLKEMLACEDLRDRRFLDIGCGSGLFSLAARKMGALVHSFDCDPQSLGCALDLKRRFFPDDPGWQVETGSILDSAYVASLGHFDVVYAWGVLHHTGALWEALGNACDRVVPGGLLFVAIYNDQGSVSQRWKQIKRIHNQWPKPWRFLILWPAFLRIWGPTLIKDVLKGRPWATWRHYDSSRGMSPWHDLRDWVGGYPFEVAKPEEVLDYCRHRAFDLARLRTVGGGRGCNEFVFSSCPTPLMSNGSPAPTSLC